MMCNRLHTFKIMFKRFKAWVIDYMFSKFNLKSLKAVFKCFKLLVIDYIVLIINYNFKNNFKNIFWKLCGQIFMLSILTYNSNLKTYHVNQTWISLDCLMFAWIIHEDILEIKIFLSCLRYAWLLISSKSSWSLASTFFL